MRDKIRLRARNVMWVGETYRGVFVELVGGDVVDGEDDLDVVGFGLLEEGFNLLSTIFVE